MSPRDTRRSDTPRAAAQQPISLRFNHFSEFTEALLGDISASGMFVSTRQPHPVASVFEFRLQLGDPLPPVNGKAQVVWVRSRDEGEGRPSGMGARFVELDDAGRDLIQSLVVDRRGSGEGQLESADPATHESREAVIAEHIKTLRLPAFAREYAAKAREAREGDWEYEEFLRQLLEAEVVSRRKRAAARRLRAARFPEHKSLEQIDWQALQGVSRAQLDWLASCEYIDRGEDVVFAGPTGTGKSHLAIALGIEATRRSYRVLFRRAADLVRELIEARDERELRRLQRRLERADLLICDELGFVPLDRTGGELLLDLLSARCERRSTMVTTHLAPGEWTRLFGDDRLATALLDRLSDHGHFLTLTGPSYRRRSDGTTGGGRG